jgi:hypothetical protein
LFTDHISQLRQCILSKGRLSLKSLDACAFWKQAYEKSEAAQSDLLDRNYELSLQIEQLRNGTLKSKAVGIWTGVKRKRDVNPPLAKPSIDSKSTSTSGKRVSRKGTRELAAETGLDFEIHSQIEGRGYILIFLDPSLPISQSQQSSLGLSLHLGKAFL